MNARLVRMVLALLLVAAGAVKLTSSLALPGDFRGNIAGLLTNQGYAVAAAQYDGQPISITPPTCASPVVLLPLTMNLQELVLLDELAGPDYRRRLFYVDDAWNTENRTALRFAWLRHKAAAVAGLERRVHLDRALLVAEPEGCTFAGSVDWRPLWRAPDAKPVTRAAN
jgi:hypothetical protein